jgi:hypothetical protein
MRYILALTGLFLVAGCTGSTPTNAIVECTDLYPRHYRACYGPGWNEPQSGYNKPFETYTVSLEESRSDGAYYLLFDRQYQAREVRADLLSLGKRDVVKFDRATGAVIFDIGLGKENPTAHVP